MLKSKLYHIENSKGWRANSVDLDEVAQFEPPHQHLRCLQVQLFSSVKDTLYLYKTCSDKLNVYFKTFVSHSL